MDRLESARERIDSIDTKLIELFKERMNIAADIAQYKKEKGLTVLNRTREREILSRMAERAGEGMENYTKILYSTLFDLSRSYQTKLNSPKSALSERIENAIKNTDRQLPKKAMVACQGVEGAYSQIACDKLFSLPGIMYFRTFEGVFQAVEQGLCQYGVLPIENSTAGSVNQVYDMMDKHHFYIVSGIKLKIEHRLLSKKGTSLRDIKEIYSHEQAINQCSTFLKSNPQIKVTVCENTAAAAKAVSDSDRRDIAAISSKDCAELYSLEVLSDSVQNTNNNYTRFILISKKLEIYPGANKSSIMLSLPHKPGSLHGVISQFSAAGMNLTKLESRPIAGEDFEFLFYFDVEGSVYDENTIELLGRLDNDLERFVYLGSYCEA